MPHHGVWAGFFFGFFPSTLCVWLNRSRASFLQKHNGRLTDARPQDPRQTIPEAPDRRSDDRSPRPQMRTPSAPLRYAKRPRRSCWIRCGVWGPPAVITSSRTILLRKHVNPLYFSHSVANVLARCMLLSVCSDWAWFVQDVKQRRIRQESSRRLSQGQQVLAEKTTY